MKRQSRTPFVRPRFVLGLASCAKIETSSVRLLVPILLTGDKAEAGQRPSGEPDGVGTAGAANIEHSTLNSEVWREAGSQESRNKAAVEAECLGFPGFRLKFGSERAGSRWGKRRRVAALQNFS